MNRFAIVHSYKVHQIIQQETMPVYGPTPSGGILKIIDITNNPDVKEGWGYDAETGSFSEPIPPESVEAEYYAILDHWGYVVNQVSVSLGEMPPDGAIRLNAPCPHYTGCKYEGGEFITMEVIYEKLNQIYALLAQKK